MGSRANAVVIEDGKRHVYCHRWAAQTLDALMFWGTEVALAEIHEWDDGYPDSDDEPWLDNVWAEGGCCIDFDRRHLLLYGGDDIECDVLRLETYMNLIRYPWEGWSVEWAWGELGQIARYAGVVGAQLEEIDCKATCHPMDFDAFLKGVIDISDLMAPGSCALSVKRDGALVASFLDCSQPEELLLTESRIEELFATLGDAPLIYDSDEFLMGSLHLDYDARKIWLWRTWGNNIDFEAPGYWDGWELHDLKCDYRAFYAAVPDAVEFAPFPEDVYLGKIGKWLCRDEYCFAPGGLPAEERTRRFSEILVRYKADNPEQRMLPELAPAL